MRKIFTRFALPTAVLLLVGGGYGLGRYAAGFDFAHAARAEQPAAATTPTAQTGVWEYCAIVGITTTGNANSKVLGTVWVRYFRATGGAQLIGINATAAAGERPKDETDLRAWATKTLEDEGFSLAFDRQPDNPAVYARRAALLKTFDLLGAQGWEITEAPPPEKIQDLNVILPLSRTQGLNSSTEQLMIFLRRPRI